MIFRLTSALGMVGIMVGLLGCEKHDWETSTKEFFLPHGKHHGEQGHESHYGAGHAAHAEGNETHDQTGESEGHASSEGEALEAKEKSEGVARSLF